MERKELEEQLFEIISQLYNKDVEELTLDTRFAEDLGGASMIPHEVVVFAEWI